ncbi:MAG: FAD-binding protein, partial [Thiohalomonadales bacterium]|nr:FAD-binding protein [Thiohalomonadales bacterium]
MQIDSDVLIIGTGAAGLSLALRLADNYRISLISKGPLKEGSTLYAQGGVAAVLASDDTLESHIEDTINAGAGLCDPDVVRYTVERGPENIQWLLDQGIHFTTEHHKHALHLTREGGHSHRRVIHATDATGKAIETTLEEKVRQHPNITIYENHIAVNLITAAKLGHPIQRCLGAYILDRDSNRVDVFRAAQVVLATGGASKVYLYTSNPDTSTGDGIAMAWRAGCRVANMEFNQFHPTCLYHPKAKSSLITEAIRGEGGRLLLADGTPFMEQFDPRGELAPRDIVARAIDHEMKRL